MASIARDSYKLLGAILALLSSPGCAVGPRYVAPATPTMPAFKELPAGNEQWKASTPRDGEIRGKWWEVFNDPQLNQLEEAVDVSNQSIKQADAVFRQARSIVAVNRTGYYPTVTTGPGISTTSRALSSTNNTSSNFALPVAASWEPDLWGRTRLSVENAVAATQSSAADLQNLRLLVQSEIANNYFLLHATDMTEQILQDSLATYERALKLTNDRYNGGIASKADVLLAETQLQTVRAQATDLHIQRAQYEHAIAVLTGQPPANLSIPKAPILGGPPSVPVGVPSQLLERRPDIASTERRLAALNAQIGLAETAFYPTFTLSGALGLQGGSIVTLFTWPGRFWSVGPSLAQALFDSGRRRAQLKGVEASYDASVASYRQTVLNGFQEVEDNLVAIHELEVEAAQQKIAVQLAERSVALELERYKGGTVSYLDVITSQNIMLSDQRVAVTILQRQMIAAVNLIRALGGGWNSSILPSPETIKEEAAALPEKPPSAKPSIFERLTRKLGS